MVFSNYLLSVLVVGFLEPVGATVEDCSTILFVRDVSVDASNPSVLLKFDKIMTK
jgi:hypothetical protein